MNGSMKLSSYAEIVKGRDVYVKFIDDLAIRHRINKQNRIFKAYRIIEDLVPIYKDDIKRDRYLKDNDLEKTIYHILIETAELNTILEQIKDRREPIFADKIVKLSDGTLSPLLETPVNSLARNTQFELSILCDFLLQNMNATLEDPNPDILLKVRGRKYYIECKRIVSPAKLEKNFKAAVKQLIPLVDNKSKDHIGIVAISITRMVHNVGMSLETSDPEGGYNFTKQTLRNFVLEYQRIWMNNKILPGDKIPAIIFHYHGIMLAHNGQKLSGINFRTITDVNSNNPLLHNLIEDLNPLTQN